MSHNAPTEVYLVTFLKNVKYIVLGALAASQLGVPSLLLDGFQGAGIGARAIQLSALLSAVTVVLFLYLVVWLPRVKGQVPNYSQWMKTPPLPTVIPLLTVSILVGFVSLVFGLINVQPARNLSLGWLRAIGGAVGVYAAVFGSIGLIPTPRPTRTPRTD